PGRDRAPRRPLPRPGAGGDAAGGGGALLALLGDAPPDDRIGGPRPAARAPPPHPPGRDGGRGEVLRREVRPPAPRAAGGVLLARLRASLLGLRAPAEALGPAGAFGLGNRGGARVLGRDDVGTLEVGKRADLALYRVDDLGRSGIADPLTAIALAPPARAEAV